MCRVCELGDGIPATQGEGALRMEMGALTHDGTTFVANYCPNCGDPIGHNSQKLAEQLLDIGETVEHVRLEMEDWLQEPANGSLNVVYWKQQLDHIAEDFPCIE